MRAHIVKLVLVLVALLAIAPFSGGIGQAGTIIVPFSVSGTVGLPKPGDGPGSPIPCSVSLSGNLSTSFIGSKIVGLSILSVNKIVSCGITPTPTRGSVTIARYSFPKTILFAGLPCNISFYGTLTGIWSLVNFVPSLKNTTITVNAINITCK